MSQREPIPYTKRIYCSDSQKQHIFVRWTGRSRRVVNLHGRDEAAVPGVYAGWKAYGWDRRAAWTVLHYNLHLINCVRSPRQKCILRDQSAGCVPRLRCDHQHVVGWLLLPVKISSHVFHVKCLLRHRKRGNRGFHEGCLAGAGNCCFRHDKVYRSHAAQQAGCWNRVVSRRSWNH